MRIPTNATQRELELQRRNDGRARAVAIDARIRDIANELLIVEDRFNRLKMEQSELIQKREELRNGDTIQGS